MILAISELWCFLVFVFFLSLRKTNSTSFPSPQCLLIELLLAGFPFFLLTDLVFSKLNVHAYTAHVEKNHFHQVEYA